jgi:catalase
MISSRFVSAVLGLSIAVGGIAGARAAAQKAIMFSPLNLQAGIEPSADPVLLARPAADGVSCSRRSIR